jgi:hypothetical protein
MDDSGQIEDIIREIATRHGVAVSRDDPILILQTINNRLLLNSATAQKELLDRFKEDLEAQASRWAHDAKQRAERLLNASMEAAIGASGDLFKAAAKESAIQARGELDGILAGVAAVVEGARRIVVLNLIAACLTAAATAVVVWTIHL